MRARATFDQVGSCATRASHVAVSGSERSSSSIERARGDLLAKLAIARDELGHVPREQHLEQSRLDAGARREQLEISREQPERRIHARSDRQREPALVDIHEHDRLGTLGCPGARDRREVRGLKPELREQDHVVNARVELGDRAGGRVREREVLRALAHGVEEQLSDAAAVRVFAIDRRELGIERLSESLDQLPRRRRRWAQLQGQAQLAHGADEIFESADGHVRVEDPRTCRAAAVGRGRPGCGHGRCNPDPTMQGMAVSLLISILAIVAFWLIGRAVGFHVSLVSSIALTAALTVVLNLAIGMYRSRRMRRRGAW